METTTPMISSENISSQQMLSVLVPEAGQAKASAGENSVLPAPKPEILTLPIPDDIISPCPNTWYGPMKISLECAMAFALLLLTAPLILIAALLVKWTSHGPAFYTQIRVGRHGRLFKIYKIRTMYHECERLTGPRWALPGDSRITRIGAVLRRSHLDELPQLVNVLLGQMSLIGPRPERPEFMPPLQEAIPFYFRRLTVRPGVTGLAQIQLPPDSDLKSVRKKLAYDLFYIQKLSPGLDLKILVCTFFYVVGIPFWLSQKILLLPSGQVIETSTPEMVESGDIACQGAIA